MNIFFKRIEKKYIKLYYLTPKILSTIIFIPFLYILGWVLATPFLLIGLSKETLSFLGTIFTFSIFFFSLPKWFEIRWEVKNTWTLIGIKESHRNKKLIFYFIRGFLLSTILIFLIATPILGTRWGYWVGEITKGTILNAIFLTIGVGFAEELIFRGWLLEELKRQFGLRKAIFLQALIFSIVHIGLNLPIWQMISILFGLFLLGILLALIRIKDNYSLWGCIGLHGGLVGLWFITNNGLLLISKDAPTWLVGPGIINTNPLGGLFGISLMVISCFLYIFICKKKI